MSYCSNCSILSKYQWPLEMDSPPRKSISKCLFRNVSKHYPRHSTVFYLAKLSKTKEHLAPNPDCSRIALNWTPTIDEVFRPPSDTDIARSPMTKVSHWAMAVRQIFDGYDEWTPWEVKIDENVGNGCGFGWAVYQNWCDTPKIACRYEVGWYQCDSLLAGEVLTDTHFW